jgi:hypothetical protein
MSTSLKQSALSAVSKQYDVDGDGKLDKVEQAMRNLDTEGRGYLTNDIKVLTVFQQQLRMQKQLLLAKRLVIFFAMLLVILAIANIGVAFAAARQHVSMSCQGHYHAKQCACSEGFGTSGCHQESCQRLRRPNKSKHGTACSSNGRELYNVYTYVY